MHRLRHILRGMLVYKIENQMLVQRREREQQHRPQRSADSARARADRCPLTRDRESSAVERARGNRARVRVRARPAAPPPGARTAGGHISTHRSASYLWLPARTRVSSRARGAREITPIHTLSARDKYAVPTDHTEREAHVRSIAAGWYQRSHSGAVSGMLPCHARAGTTRGVTLAPSSRPSCRPSSHAATRPLQQRFEGAHATRQVDIEELYELLVE